MLLFFFFFFQAEDGIRDLYVTGVQTCALPICPCCCDSQSSENRPEQPVLAHCCANEFDRAPYDNRDHRRADAVEHPLNPRKAAEMNVKSCQSEHHQERRQDKSNTDHRGSHCPCPQPAEIHRELCSERARRKL